MAGNTLLAHDVVLFTRTATPLNGTLHATPLLNSGVALTYRIVTSPPHGTATITDAARGAFTYTPASGFQGTDTFTFVVTDGTRESAPASVRVQVSNTIVALPLVGR